MIPRSIHSAARTEPTRYRLLIAGRLSGISRICFSSVSHLSLVGATSLIGTAVFVVRRALFRDEAMALNKFEQVE